MIRALLLCGGVGKRFGGAKLLACLPGESTPLGVCAARALLAGAGNALAVVRPGDAALARALRDAGCDVLETPDALRGMGASLAAGVRATAQAEGWLVALGDMPRIRPDTHRAVAAALEAGALLAAAVDAHGQRGHPVGFGRALFDELSRLDGDEGARTLVAAHRKELGAVRVDDPGIFADVDTPGDLAGPAP